MPILFCNVAWMNDYAGRSADDPPLGGGAFRVSRVIARKNATLLQPMTGTFTALRDD